MLYFAETIAMGCSVSQRTVAELNGGSVMQQGTYTFRTAVLRMGKPATFVGLAHFPSLLTARGDGSGIDSSQDKSKDACDSSFLITMNSFA